MKLLRNILVGLLTVVVAAVIGKDAIITFSLEHGIKAVTGLGVSVKSLKVGIMNPVIDIKGFEAHNPKGFETKIMADVPVIYINYDLPSFFRGKIHLREVRLALKEFVVEKNAKGELNLNFIKIVKEGGAATRPAVKPEKKGKAPALQIDVLKLKVGKAVYKDYSSGGEPVVKEFDVAINEEYRDITDVSSLVSLIVVRTLRNTAISRLADFGIEKLTSTISNTLLASSGILGSAGGMLSEEAVGGVKEALAGIAGNLFKK